MNKEDLQLFKEAVEYFEFNADTYTSGCAERQSKLAKMKSAIKRLENNQASNYEEWEEKQEISPVSPEAYYAELAWKSALESIELKIVGHMYRVVGSEDAMSRDWSTPGVVFVGVPAFEEGLCTLPGMGGGGIQSMNVYAKVAK